MKTFSKQHKSVSDTRKRKQEKVTQEKDYRMVSKLRPVFEGVRYIGFLKSYSTNVFKAGFSLLSKAKWKFVLNCCMTLFKGEV